MQLKRFRIFCEHLIEEGWLKDGIKEYQIFRFSEAAYYDTSGNKLECAERLGSLEVTRERKQAWRKPKSKEALFPIADFDSVLVVKFASPPRQITLKRIQRFLEKTRKNANDAFDATHDALTGLANSKGIEHFLTDILEGDDQQSETNEKEQIKQSSSVTIIEFDIDHFKQVNDSYGHDYGDVVLQCFAMRLQNLAIGLEKKHNGVSIFLGRPGGEEFLAILNGPITGADAQSIAETFRSGVVADILPSEEEWNKIVLRSGNKSIRLPHPAERRITASLGVSSQMRPTTAERVLSVGLALRREADASLYRAKAGGRNTVRYFPEIRDKFGTVLEHHSETDIVAIDLGTAVSVKVGHEFLVYHPDFSGQKDFVFADGRSKKRLGKYPRVSCGRIVVFDVQNEISFCLVNEKKLEKFPAGSSLEYIPLGSIAHLITRTENSINVKDSLLSKSDELQAYADEIVASKQKPLAIVALLEGAEELEKSNGTAFVNRSLASLYQVLREAFPSPAKVAQIQHDQISVICKLPKEFKAEKELLSVLENAQKQCSHIAKFRAGVFCGISEFQGVAGDRSKLDPKMALKYARYAALEALDKPDNTVISFGPLTANYVVWAQRRDGYFSEGLVDYHALKGLGIVNHVFENQGALTAYSIRDFGFAVECGRRASSLHDEPVYRANTAIFLFAHGKSLEAHEIFEKLAIEFPKYEMSNGYLGAKALSAYAQYLVDNASIDLDKLKKLLQLALEHASSSYAVQNAKEQIAEALEDLG